MANNVGLQAQIAMNSSPFGKIQKPTKEGMKTFYDLMLQLSLAIASGPNKKDVETIGGQTYDFSDPEKTQGNLTMADFNLQNYSASMQFLLKVESTYINDTFKQAAQLVG